MGSTRWIGKCSIWHVRLHNCGLTWALEGMTDVYLQCSLAVWRFQARFVCCFFMLGFSPALVLPEQACVPTCCLLILHKRCEVFALNRRYPAQIRQTSTQCVNTSSTDWLSDIDSSVYTSARSKPELIMVYTLPWNREYRGEITLIMYFLTAKCPEGLTAWIPRRARVSLFNVAQLGKQS